MLFRSLKLNPSLAGKFALTLTIEEQGRVLDYSMHAVTGHNDEAFTTCVGERVKRWHFAALPESTDVTFNIFLTPQTNQSLE